MFFFNELEVGTEIMFHADEVNSLSKSLGVGSGPRRLICACPDATICLVPRSATPKGLRGLVSISDSQVAYAWQKTTNPCSAGKKG